MQWNEVLQNVLNEKLKIVKNEKTISDWKSEKTDIEDNESEMDNHDWSKKMATG